MISLREDFSVLSGFQIFGDFDLFNQDKFMIEKSKWKPCFIYALEPSVILLINFDKSY